MHPSLMYVRGNHMCVSKHVCCFKVSKSFGVGVFCQLWALWKRHWERGMALGMMSLHSNHLTHAWWYTTLCAMSHHVSFLLSCEWNSVPARNGCCVCGVNAFMFSPIAWANTCHNAFTHLHSKSTWSTVILLLHLHLSVGCARSPIWCAMPHAWLSYACALMEITIGVNFKMFWWNRFHGIRKIAKFIIILAKNMS